MAKVEVVEKHKEETFEPITLQITIESPDEFREMWHRMNFNIDKIGDSSPFKSFEIKAHDTLSQPIYDILTEYDDGRKESLIFNF